MEGWNNNDKHRATVFRYCGGPMNFCMQTFPNVKLELDRKQYFSLDKDGWKIFWLKEMTV